MSCDVGEVTESLENELCSFSKFSVTSLSWDVGKARERLENEL